MRLFTIPEANELLPRVESMLRELQRQAEELANRQRVYAEAQQNTSSNGHSIAEKLEAKRQELERLSHSLAAGVADIEDLGCTVKDLAMGLIDFPGLREDEVVNLCWRLGEPDVAYWHTMDTGFAHRQPL